MSHENWAALKWIVWMVVMFVSGIAMGYMLCWDHLTPLPEEVVFQPQQYPSGPAIMWHPEGAICLLDDGVTNLENGEWKGVYQHGQDDD